MFLLLHDFGYVAQKKITDYNNTWFPLKHKSLVYSNNNFIPYFYVCLNI